MRKHNISKAIRDKRTRKNKLRELRRAFIRRMEHVSRTRAEKILPTLMNTVEKTALRRIIKTLT